MERKRRIFKSLKKLENKLKLCVDHSRESGFATKKLGEISGKDTGNIEIKKIR